MKRSLITFASLISLAAGMLACAGQIPGVPAASATPTLEPYAVPVTYRNVSLVAPPFYTNRVTAEELELREQMNPADDVPAYQRIIIQESADFHFGPDVSRPDSQVLVYPLADLIQTFPEAAAAAAQLQVVLGPGDAPLPLVLPFWPLASYSGVIGAPLTSLGRPALTAHRQHLDFKSGRGIRYVTLLEQDPPRVHRLDGLIYTFQGLTDDRLYYVSIILPLGLPDNIPGNPEGVKVLQTLAGEAAPDYAAIAQGLDRVPPESFHLTLAQCDALVRSLAVGP